MHTVVCKLMSGSRENNLLPKMTFFFFGLKHIVIENSSMSNYSEDY